MRTWSSFSERRRFANFAHRFPFLPDRRAVEQCRADRSGSCNDAVKPKFQRVTRNPTRILGCGRCFRSRRRTSLAPRRKWMRRESCEDRLVLHMAFAVASCPHAKAAGASASACTSGSQALMDQMWPDCCAVEHHPPHHAQGARRSGCQPPCRALSYLVVCHCSKF